MVWETPQFLFDALNTEFGFDLDVCASPANAKCLRFFTENDDALTQIWDGNIWMNPPYGRGIGAWVGRARQQVDSGHADVAVCLVPMRSDSKWFHEHAMKASEIRLLDQRLEFAGSTNKAPFPAVLLVFRSGDSSAKLTSYDVRAARNPVK